MIENRIVQLDFELYSSSCWQQHKHAYTSHQHSFSNLLHNLHL